VSKDNLIEQAISKATKPDTQMNLEFFQTDAPEAYSQADDIEALKELPETKTQSLFGRQNTIKDVLVSMKTEEGQKKAGEIWVDYATVTSDQAKRIHESTGIWVDGSFVHMLDGSGLQHALRQHGNKTESQEHQLPLTGADFEMLPEIIANPDQIVKGKDSPRNNLKRIVYIKRINGHTLAVEEVRTGKRKLAFTTMRKIKSGYQFDTTKPDLPAVKIGNLGLSSETHSQPEAERSYVSDSKKMLSVRSEPAATIPESGVALQTESQKIRGETAPNASQKSDPDANISPETSSVNEKTDVFELDNPQAMEESAARVSDDVKRQLVDAGVNEAEAEANGDIVAAAMIKFAKRKGLSPEAFYKRLGLTFVRDEITGEDQGQPGRKGPRGAINLSDPNRVTITLTPRADVTTNIHELGHLFRFIMERQAAEFTDDAQLQSDWQEIQAFGDHEKFADGFIEYVKTGKAPSSTLQRVFEQFKQWLTDFYDAIRGKTGIELSDEMRGVFDRILAGDSTFEATYGMENSLRSTGNQVYYQDEPKQDKKQDPRLEPVKSKNPNLEVMRQKRDTSNNTVMMDLVNSPHIVAERHAKFSPFFHMANEAQAKRSGCARISTAR
jgi:hypothetical protein